MSSRSSRERAARSRQVQAEAALTLIRHRAARGSAAEPSAPPAPVFTWTPGIAIANLEGISRVSFGYQQPLHQTMEDTPMSRSTTDESPRHDDAGDAAILAAAGQGERVERPVDAVTGMPILAENERLALFPVVGVPEETVGAPGTFMGEPIGIAVGVDHGLGPDYAVMAMLQVDGSTVTARLGSPSGFNANGDSVSPAAFQDQTEGRTARGRAEDANRRAVNSLIAAFNGDRVPPRHFSMQFRELGATPNQNGDALEPGALPVPPVSEMMTRTSHRYRLPRTPTVARAAQAPATPTPSQDLWDGLRGMSLQQAEALVAAGVTRAEIAAVVELGGTDALDRLYGMSGGEAHAFRSHAIDAGAVFPPAAPSIPVQGQAGPELSGLNFDVRQILSDNVVRDMYAEEDHSFFDLSTAGPASAPVAEGDLRDASTLAVEPVVEPLAQWRELAEQLAPTNTEDENAVQLWRNVSLDPRTALHCLAPVVEGVTYDERARQAVSILVAIQQLHEVATASGNRFTAASAIQALTHLALGGEVPGSAAAKVPNIWSAAHKAGRAVFVEKSQATEARS